MRVPVEAEKDEVVLHEVDKHLSDQLSHVHATDHLFKNLQSSKSCHGRHLRSPHSHAHLFSRVDGHLVDDAVPLGPAEVELAVVPEGAPLRVDDHVLHLDLSHVLVFVLVEGADGGDVLQVAGVGARPQDEADAGPRVLPRAAHQAAGRVVQDGAHI